MNELNIDEYCAKSYTATIWYDEFMLIASPGEGELSLFCVPGGGE